MELVPSLGKESAFCTFIRDWDKSFQQDSSRQRRGQFSRDGVICEQLTPRTKNEGMNMKPSKDELSRPQILSIPLPLRVNVKIAACTC